MLRFRQQSYAMNEASVAKGEDSGGDGMVVVTDFTATGARKLTAAAPAPEAVGDSSSCSSRVESSTDEVPGSSGGRGRGGRAHKDPLSFCTFIVKFPKTAFGITLSGHLVMLLVSLVLVALGKDVFPAEFRQVPFELRGQDVTLKYWAWAMRNDPSYVIRRFSWSIQYWNRAISIDPLQVIFNTHEKGNIFEKRILLQLREFENQMLKGNVYTENLCQLDINQTCVLPNSILRYFDGSYVDVSPVFNDSEFDNITAVVWEASHNPSTSRKFNYFLGIRTNITKDMVFTDYTRSEYFIGFPIEKVDSWYSYTGKILFHDVATDMEELQKEVAPDLSIAPINWNMFIAGAGIYGTHDVFLVSASVLFIFIFMWFHTQSFFITFWAVFSIVTSFFGTNLIYRYILDFQYFGYFHLIAMFIILGIGADDIFVFFNTWKASDCERYRSSEDRLSEVYRHAAVSMFVTSFTTMVAFFVTSLTPLIAARSFGIFTGMLVIINYISVVVFFPTVVYLYHVWFEGKDTWRACRKKISQLCFRKKTEPPGENMDDNVQDGNIDRLLKPKQSLLVQFFAGPYYRVITHPILRWCLLTIFLGIFAFFTWGASTLKADSEQVMIFKESTVLGRGWKLLFTAFQPSDYSLLMTNVVWGLMPRNDDNCHFSDYTCRGDPVFDDNFDMNIPSVQLAMNDFCRRLKYNLTEEQLRTLNIRRNDQGEAEVQCFTDNLQRFLKDEEYRLNQGPCRKKPLDLSLPLTERKVLPFMECQPCFYDMNKLKPSFHRYFEIMVSYWITNRYTMIPTPDHRTFNGLLGEAYDGDHTHIVEAWNNNSAGCPDFIKDIEKSIPAVAKLPDSSKPRYGTRLRFAAISVNLTTNFFGLGYTTGLVIYDSWERYLREHIPKLPPQMRLAMQTNKGQWHWLFVQKTLVNSALVGVVLGIALALPVLILATGNLIIGTMATMIIAATCVCVIGVIPLFGWKLGMLVSVNLCLVVGLSIDYIVHLSEAYHMSKCTNRLDLVHDILSKTGISIIAGAGTTLGASMFMFFGKTQFFLQFAVFMFSTISFSVVFSLGLFPIVMALCGPVGEVGSILPIWQGFKSCFTGRKKSDVTCTDCQGRGFRPLPEKSPVGNEVEDEDEEEEVEVGENKEVDVDEDENEVVPSV